MSPGRFFRLPLIFAAAHAALVLFVWFVVNTSEDGETGILWGVFLVIDFPVVMILLRVVGESSMPFCLLVFGGAWWAGIGVLVQLFATVYRSIHRP
ncbi:MAG TPA: hypothetical protein VKD71_07590 [Gemmataceae bacterium]|nr:hypothetical protein [Gemmataceae bacterium]